MTVASAAFDAYSQYVSTLKVPHVFHTLKKGLLKLMQQPARDGGAERMLGMIANNLVEITNTQRSPRPLARYLVTNLAKRTGHAPQIAYCNRRHTAMYRAAALPAFDKPAAKEEGDLRNHAVDAIMLGCRFPSAAALENKKWYRSPADVWAWREQVRLAAPVLQNGLPKVEPVELVENFEDDIGDGYARIDLSAFNWNRKRKGTHGLDPLAINTNGTPRKRESAGEVLVALRLTGKRNEKIAAIANQGLRKLLSAEPEHAPLRFVCWLQRTVAGGLANNNVGPHSADQERARLLREFVSADAAMVVAGEIEIPWTIGVSCLSLGSRGLADVSRVGKDGKVFQHYKADPPVREIWVGYREVNGTLDTAHPIVYCTNQIQELQPYPRKAASRLTWPANHPLAGRPLGSKGKVKEFLEIWRRAFADFAEEQGIVRWFRLTQGCVVEKADGRKFQLRNFDKSQPWMKDAPFRDIVRVHRSPFQVM